MAWVRVVPRASASGHLAEIYRGWTREPEPPEVITVFSTWPELMDVRIRFQDRITFGGSGLGRYREELIAVSISAALECRY